MRVKSWVFLFAGPALLSGCQRSPVVQPAQPASVSRLGLVPLSQIDLGATLLAEVENARVALDAGDPVAASNDVAQALSFAMQLPNQPSNLIRSGPMSNDAPVTAFGVEVELSSAQAQLPGDLKAADAHLRNIQDGIPQGSIPADLALLGPRQAWI